MVMDHCVILMLGSPEHSCSTCPGSHLSGHTSRAEHESSASFTCTKRVPSPYQTTFDKLVNALINGWMDQGTSDYVNGLPDWLFHIMCFQNSLKTQAFILNTNSEKQKRCFPVQKRLHQNCQVQRCIKVIHSIPHSFNKH